MFTSKQVYGIGWDLQNPGENVLMEVLRRYAEKGEEIKSNGEYLRRRLESVDERLEADFHVNSLGELQQTARDYDRLCTERQQYAEEVNRTVWVLRKSGTITPERLVEVLSTTPFAVKED